MLNAEEHLPLLHISDTTCVHTLEKSHTPARMKVVAGILPHQVICDITSVRTMVKEPLSVSIQDVIVCLHGLHTWNIIWRRTQGTEHIAVLLKDATKAFMCCSDSMFTWEFTQVNDHTHVMWRTAWNRLPHKGIWRITCGYTQVYYDLFYQTIRSKYIIFMSYTLLLFCTFNYSCQITTKLLMIQ